MKYGVRSIELQSESELRLNGIASRLCVRVGFATAPVLFSFQSEWAVQRCACELSACLVCVDVPLRTGILFRKVELRFVRALRSHAYGNVRYAARQPTTGGAARPGFCFPQPCSAKTGSRISGLLYSVLRKYASKSWRDEEQESKKET